MRALDSLVAILGPLPMAPKMDLPESKSLRPARYKEQVH